MCRIIEPLRKSCGSSWGPDEIDLLSEGKNHNTIHGMNKTPLKKPVIVYIIALAFIVSPFVNFWLSTRNLKLPESVSTLDLIRNMKATDAALNILIFLAGALLLKTHKLTWAFAVLCLALVTIFNVNFLINSGGVTNGAFAGQIWMSLAATLAGWVILFYARFPYLDRRDTWTGTATRFIVKIPVEIDGHGEHMISNVSSTGARVDLKSPLSLEKSSIISLKFKEAGTQPLKGRVVDYDGNLTLRVEFERVSRDYKLFMKKLKDQSAGSV
jgi:hypothetical protein